MFFVAAPAEPRIVVLVSCSPMSLKLITKGTLTLAVVVVGDTRKNACTLRFVTHAKGFLADRGDVPHESVQLLHSHPRGLLCSLLHG